MVNDHSRIIKSFKIYLSFLSSLDEDTVSNLFLFLAEVAIKKRHFDHQTGMILVTLVKDHHMIIYRVLSKSAQTFRKRCY
jgi:hypothetical protein